MTASKTIRELGGEIWSELNERVSEEDARFDVKNRIVDIVMGVLARHEGATIRGDEDLPVEALPQAERPR